MIIKKRKKNKSGKILSFKLFLIFSVVLVVFLSVGVGEEYYREYQIQKEISSLTNEIDYFEKNNYKLSQLMEYYQTKEYKELEARKRLNMQKEGESVVIISQYDTNSTESAVENENKIAEMANYIKWWNYFFATKK
ncbi:septum formation initiator family protein [Patescibacteria group bacterium]|nr:septum formation initiator family protein [Patescibacteria group bacterium]